MPEYLAPGVFVEEVSFRSKSIEGVPTSTTGFAGMVRFGPVRYPTGPKTTEPRLITSFTEFERVYGGLEPFFLSGTDRTAYVAHAARAFFLNGGRRLYISRVFAPDDSKPTDDEKYGIAKLQVPVGTTVAEWRSRWPGAMGNVYVSTTAVRSKNIAYNETTNGFGVQARGVSDGAVVEIFGAADTVLSGSTPLDINKLYIVRLDANGKQSFMSGNPFSARTMVDGDVIQLVELRATVGVSSERVDVYDRLGAHPKQKRFVGRILQLDDPEDENAAVWLKWDWTQPASDADVTNDYPARLMVELTKATTAKRLTGGHDGVMVTAADLAGEEADPDNADNKATGLEALGEIDDIAIVALPDAGTYETDDEAAAATDALIAHAEKLKYRIAVVDGRQGSSLSEIREFRGRFDSTRAALYHPWIEIFDPLERPSQGAPPKRLLLPPSGFVCGIYARTDVERGVYKAPANEVIRGLTRFEANINKARNEVLNPEGINSLRFFEGRGSRVWGARTMSSDPEWKYVNVRRLFNFIEHSIDKGTQWAVFEPNNDRLWGNIRQTIEDFLLNLWKDGALLGTKADEAFFVRCDRTTMTQYDLDNGRLICLVGLAPTKPAEFVIIRVGQWTADSSR